MTESSTAIIYCRVSSGEQVGGTSLGSQEQICREYAQRHGLEVLEAFIERGESAKTADRTEFQRALAYCAKHRNKIGYFIFYKVDRFSRYQADHHVIADRIRRYGIRIRSATEPIDETPTGRMVEGILAAHAQFDNDQRRERTMRGMQERVKQGVWVWPAPVGYHRTARGVNISPDPAQAPFVRLAFTEYSRGTYTFEALARFLERRGFRSRAGKPPRKQEIEKMLRNPIYAGVIRAWGAQVQGAFEPIISPELFEQCQPDSTIIQSLAAPRRRANPRFPLRGLLICSACSGKLTGSHTTGRHGVRYPYYHHQTQRCDRARFLSKAAVESAFVSHLRSITPELAFEEMFKGIVGDVWRSMSHQSRERDARLKQEIARLEHHERRILELHRDGLYSDADFIEQRALVLEQRQQKTRLLEGGSGKPFDLRELAENAFRFIRNTAETWIDLEPKHSLRLEFQRLVFDDTIPFDGNTFGTARLGCVYELSRNRAGLKSLLVAPGGQEWHRLVRELERWERFAVHLAEADRGGS